MFQGFFVSVSLRLRWSLCWRVDLRWFNAILKYFSDLAMSHAKPPASESSEEEPSLPPLPVGARNYITPAGYARLKAELFELIDTERPKVVDIVHWAASNGDRSENGDYIYGKKRLREIDRRIRFLTQRLELAEITDPSIHHGRDQVFFGATVVYLVDGLNERCVTIMGIDEADSAAGEISWVSPAARTLLKARVGDELSLLTPQGVQLLEVLQVRYPAPPG